MELRFLELRFPGKILPSRLATSLPRIQSRLGSSCVSSRLRLATLFPASPQWSRVGSGKTSALRHSCPARVYSVGNEADVFGNGISIAHGSAVAKFGPVRRLRHPAPRASLADASPGAVVLPAATIRQFE